MLRNRLLFLVGGSLLATSVAWADGVGYIDCSGHPDPTQVFAKARQSHEVVASLACGERFTVLQNGFIFSRIQTRDGKVGYVFSNLISPDRSGASVPPPTATQLPTSAPSAPATPAVTQPTPPATAQPQAAPAQPAATQAPLTTPNSPSTPATDLQAKSGASTQTTPQPAPIEASSQSTQTVPAQPQPAPVQLTPAETAAPTASVPEVAAPAQPASAPVIQPDATPAAQPEPAPAADATTPAIRPASAKESWEKPNAGVRAIGPRTLPLIELFGGYAFTRFDGGGGTWTNLNGVLGSFGWNVKPWLQIVADTSYDFVTVSGTKTVVYGNHYGPRLFGRMRNRWGIVPFVEGLVGGSRADVSVSGTGGYSTSTNCISYKMGGGLDLKPSRRFEIRLIDVDYYRTAFGTNIHQNNYWASAGIVIRLFGGSE